MSVYKPKGRDTYVIDFQCGGRRFCASTAATNRREAERLEVAERESAKQVIAQERAEMLAIFLDVIIGDACL